jgi:hypothetical protein
MRRGVSHSLVLFENVAHLLPRNRFSNTSFLTLGGFVVWHMHRAEHKLLLCGCR